MRHADGTRSAGALLRVAGFVLFAGSIEAGDATGWEIWVELTDKTGLPSAVMDTLMREVEAIYEGASVEVRWLTESSALLPDHAARVFVLERLPAKLETRIRMFRRQRAMAVSLGAGPANQAIFVSRPAVCASAYGFACDFSLEPLGVALGRVVAHELAHRFVSRDHSPGGILKASLRGGELTGPSRGPHFTAEEIDVLRRIARPVSMAAAP
jgi:hypothetical protein